MLKLHHAVYCYYLLGFSPDMHAWLLIISESRKTDTFTFISDDERAHLSKAATAQIEKKIDFDMVIKTLVGDAFFDKHKSDVAKIEKLTGKKIITIWDTDSVFLKFPHLKNLGRNKFFEENIWPKVKAKQK